MNDAETALTSLKELVRRFGEERDWQPFHTPKNLVMGMAVETAELMEHFLWVDPAQSFALIRDPDRRQAIGEEMADVLAYLLGLSNVLGIDLSGALEAKMVKNALKYPAGKYRGRYEATSE